MSERVCTHKFALTIGRTTLVSQPLAVPTSCPSFWCADCGGLDELATVPVLNRAAMANRQFAKYPTLSRNHLLQRLQVLSSATTAHFGLSMTCSTHSAW